MTDMIWTYNERRIIGINPDNTPCVIIVCGISFRECLDLNQIKPERIF